VAICGGGGFTMLLGELLTLHQTQLPVKIILFNSAYDLPEPGLRAAGAPDYDTQLASPSFAQLAESVGIRGFRVSDPGQLEGVLREALAHEGPVVVEALVDRERIDLGPYADTGVLRAKVVAALPEKAA
ncbi:MAG: ubiquinone-dependent pyruvate dehydrogenase, partial [Hymenobacter sp.]